MEKSQEENIMPAPNFRSQSSVTCQSSHGFTMKLSYVARSPRRQDDSYQLYPPPGCPR